MRNMLSCFEGVGRLKLVGSFAAITLSLLGCSAGTDLSGNTVATANANANSASIVLNLIDVPSNTDKNSISLSSSTQLRAVLKDASGRPLPNQVVRFVPEAKDILVLTPAGSALTDENGFASVFAAPAGLTVAGAYSISAEALVSGTSFKATRNFSIGVNNVSISALTVSSPVISAYGTTTISASVAGLPAGTTVKVAFSSTCGGNGRATVTSISDTIKGVATATYKDNACAGADTITATVQGTSVSSNAIVTSNAPAIANIGFVAASSQTIILKGTGAAGASEVSIVKFRVFDQSGQPYTVPTSVTFSLSTFTGGLLLDNTSGSVTKSSNGFGDVDVVVSAGSVPTPVTVKASITDPVSGVIRTTESIKLSVSTGRPTQDFFSLSATAYNIEGWDYDGTKSIVTARAADRLANPVPDGTSVSFVAEGASVGASCQTTGGACSVDFLSQEKRPRQGAGSPPTSIARTSAGRVTLLSYAIGEESFSDLNANNLYDAGEPFSDLGSIFIDNLETASYDINTHQVIPFSNPGLACVNPPVGVFNVPSIAATCDGKWGTAQVRRAAVFVLSGSTAYLAASSNGAPATYGVNSLDRNLILPSNTCSVIVPFFVQDENGNSMAAGTKIEVDVSAAPFVTSFIGSSPIADSVSRGGSPNFVAATGLDPLSNACRGKGTLKVVVTSTKGFVTAFLFSITLGP